MKSIRYFALLVAAAFLVNFSFAQKEKTVEVGGAAMYPSKIL